MKSRIAELQHQAAAKTLVTIESITAELNASLAVATRQQNPSAMTSASMAKAKLHGLVVDRAEVEQTVRRKPTRDPAAPARMTAQEWEEKIRTKATPVKHAIEIEIGFRPQPGPQQAFIDSPADITIYGGARGGGKSFAALGDFWLHAEEFGPHARGLMIRRHRVDLRDTIVIAQRLYGSAAKWKEHGSYFQFESGSRLDMAYLESEADAASFQGWTLSRSTSRS